MSHHLLVGVLLSCLCNAEFPNSSDPVTASPPVRVRGSFCGRASVFTNLQLPTDGSIAYGSFGRLPCPDTAFVTGVVLRFRGAIHGVQFDRYGAVWVGGVEVLRTTTPEPTPAGIHWNVDRDLTEYLSLFQQSQNVSISIPNTVDKHYTGVLDINVSFDFYAKPALVQDALISTKVLGILDPIDVLEKPWEVMRVVGHGWLNVSLPSIPRDTKKLFLDVFASGHGCEEFEAGYDCGSPLRRIRVYVADDSGDRLVGVTYPFPVIYTGGVNPLLWRPLTGISSFDLPPYRFEVTPFLPLLLGSSGRRLCITVDNDTPIGFWFLDPIFVCTLSTPDEYGRVVGGELIQANLSESSVTRNISNRTVIAEDRSDFIIRGELHFADPRAWKREVKVEGFLSAWANYTTIGAPGGPTTPPNHRIVHGQRRGEVTVTETDSYDNRQRWKTLTFNYPYAINLNQTQHGNAFDIFATVSYAREGSAFGLTGGVYWSTQIMAEATYQRNQNFSVLVAQNDASEECVVQTTRHGLCYRKRLEALNGSIAFKGSKAWTCSDVGLDELVRQRTPQVVANVQVSGELFV